MLKSEIALYNLMFAATNKHLELTDQEFTQFLSDFLNCKQVKMVQSSKSHKALIVQPDTFLGLVQDYSVILR